MADDLFDNKKTICHKTFQYKDIVVNEERLKYEGIKQSKCSQVHTCEDTGSVSRKWSLKLKNRM